MKRILVTGSRDWVDALRIADALNQFGPGIVVHGTATGADDIADAIAAQWGWPREPHAADWAKHGRRAGPIRNRQMVDLGADVCLAFIRNNSRGASHCAGLAEQAGIPTYRYTE